mmetsp:Transcript_28702/g.48849  ORF Transcript_28702/g.48849 Transcript_28702/m.48849 type:complete len:92 (-) Transcript_28702:1758-2033(-)
MISRYRFVELNDAGQRIGWRRGGWAIHRMGLDPSVNEMKLCITGQYDTGLWSKSKTDIRGQNGTSMCTVAAMKWQIKDMSTGSKMESSIIR